MNTVLVLIWIALTIAVWAVAVISLLQTQMILDRLQTTDPKNWANVESLGKIVLKNLLWMGLVVVALAELVSLAFPEVRGWMAGNLLIALAVYLVPLLALAVALIVTKKR